MARRVGRLVLLFGGDSKRDPAVERHNVELDVEALTVGVRPYASESGPEAFLSLTVTYLVGDVARAFRGGFGFLLSDMVFSCFSSYQPRPSRPDGNANKVASVRGESAPGKRKAEGFL
jgi:hypothetical protein